MVRSIFYAAHAAVTSDTILIIQWNLLYKNR